MKFLSGLSRGAVVVTATTVLGSTFAVTGAVWAGPARAAAVIDTSSQSAFIRSIAPLAQEGQRAYRVPASVAMAQAILESGWGRSTLTTRGNAFFGIKCSTAMGPYATGCLNMRTREVFSGTPTVIIDGFRTYDDPVDSFKDHGRFLTVNSRYRAAFDHTNDPQRFIAEVHRAGYATDPTYTALIVRLMDQLDLYRFDTPLAASPSATESASATPSPSATQSASATPSPSATESASATPSPSATESPSATPSPSATESASPVSSETASVMAPTPTISVPVPVSSASADWSAFGSPAPSASASAFSQVSYAIPSTEATRSNEATPTGMNSPQTPSPMPTGAVTTPHPTPTAPTTPSANSTLTPRLTATPATSGTSSVLAAPAANRTPSATASPSETMRTADVTAPATEASAAVETDPQPRVGDGVAPDPSIEPGTESASGATLTERTDSPSPDRRVPTQSAATPIGTPEAFDPRGVRATQPQDPAKAGAQQPDGARVTAEGLRPQYERHGGLARTGW